MSEANALPVLELERLTVRYGGVVAVRDLDLEVRRGEIVGLIGPNGAGKSTTLHAIMGAVPVDAGDVRVEGRSLRGRAPESIARSGVALVPVPSHMRPPACLTRRLRCRSA